MYKLYRISKKKTSSSLQLCIDCKLIFYTLFEPKYLVKY